MILLVTPAAFSSAVTALAWKPGALAGALAAVAWGHAALGWVLPPLAGAIIGLLIGLAAATLIIRHAFSGPVAGRAAARIIPGLTSSLLERPLAELAGPPEALGAAVSKSVSAALRGFVTLPWFLQEVRQSIAVLVSSICALPVADVLTRVDARRFLVERLLPALSQEESRRRIAQTVGKAVGENTGALLSGRTLESVSQALDHLIPVVIERLIEWLESREMRETLASRGRELLPRVLEKLNLMQRFLLSAGQFDKRIDEKMPEIVDETLDALERLLRETAQQRAVRDKVLLALQDWRSSIRSSQDAALVVSGLVDGILDRLTDPAARESSVTALEGFLTESGQTLGSLLRRRAGLSESEIADSAANAALTWLSRSETAPSISAWVGEKVSAYFRGKTPASAAEVLGVNALRKEKIDSILIQIAARLTSTPGTVLTGGLRVGALRWVGALGALVGLLVGLFEDALRAMGVF